MKTRNAPICSSSSMFLDNRFVDNTVIAFSEHCSRSPNACVRYGLVAARDRKPSLPIFLSRKTGMAWTSFPLFFRSRHECGRPPWTVC